MIVTTTQLANDSNGVIDRVLERNEKAEIRRHGKVEVEIRRRAGVSKSELLKILKSVKLTERERAELAAAMKQAGKILAVL